MMKRLSAVALIFSILVLLSACGAANLNSTENKISVVCTTFAAYDWTREIIGDNIDEFEVTLIGDGVDLHSFQPTTGDIAKIHTADLLVQIGGITEEWTGDLNLENKRLKLFDLLDAAEKICTNANHTGHKHSDKECDEHIWLSVRLAQRMVNAICGRICDLDRANGVEYQKNCAEYVEKLKYLDTKYQSAVQKSKDKAVVFADRYPFGYLMRDYGIISVSVFDGCSSDANAGFDTITKLAESIEKYNKDTVLILENSAESVAVSLKAVLGDRPLDTAVMNSCQNIDMATAQNTSYIDIMTKNLESLKKALRG